MSTLSLHAQRTLEQLQESWVVNQFIHSDATRNDAHCPSPNNPNANFNAKREYYLGSLQVCHAGDALNSYCQSILGEIIKIDDAAWLAFDATIKENRKVAREVMIERLFTHKATDRVIREYLRNAKICHWPFESEIITLLRNKFVHQSGHDPKREIEQLIASKRLPWCPICVDARQGADVVRYIDSEWLDADVDLGQWACAHIKAHIHTMDQNLCFRFKLPRDRWRPRPISRQLGSLSSPRSAAPLTTQTTTMESKTSKISHPPEVVTPTLPSGPKPSQKEIDCARARHRLKDEIFAFIKSYVKEAGVSVTGQWGGAGGTTLPHTIRGHDIAIEYDLVDAQQPLDNTERLGIRIRERDFEPYVTIWSRKTLMRDFVATELNEEIKNHLRDVIDKVITH